MTSRRILANGLGVSPGKATGKIVICKKVSDLAKVQDGNIIVVPASSPAWTQGMLRGAGFISERGGIICHVAIVAREIGVPCIVGVEKATEILKDGMKVEIDGKEGVIYETD